MRVYHSNKPDVILEAFDKFPGEEVIVYYPGSGSWCEVYNIRQEYTDRQDAEEAYREYMKDNCPGGIHDDGANRLFTRVMQTSNRRLSADVWWMFGDEQHKRYAEGTDIAVQQWNEESNRRKS
jgi:hypothetical protein